MSPSITERPKQQPSSKEGTCHGLYRQRLHNWRNRQWRVGAAATWSATGLSRSWGPCWQSGDGLAYVCTHWGTTRVERRVAVLLGELQTLARRHDTGGRGRSLGQQDTRLHGGTVSTGWASYAPHGLQLGSLLYDANVCRPRQDTGTRRKATLYTGEGRGLHRRPGHHQTHGPRKNRKCAVQAK